MRRIPLLAMALLCATADAPVAAPFDPFSSAAIEDRLGAALPAADPLIDTDGRAVTLGDFLGARPLLLVPVDFDCRTICGVTLAGLFEALGRMALQPGRDFEVVALGIDPRDGPPTARVAMAEALERYGRPEGTGAVHFLSGHSAAITAAAGFHYAFDDETDQYTHPAAAAVVTADGRLARWLYGYPFEPQDIRLALTEAGGGTIGTLADRLWLLCYSYDPVTGRYSWAVEDALRIGCGLTALGLGGVVLVMLRRERQSRRTS